MDHLSGLLTGASAPSVRVQRAGNSKVLPLPAELARQNNVDLGEVYTVEVAGDDVIYHRRDAHGVTIHGTGSGRYGVIDDADVMAAPQRSSIPPPDWDM